MRIWRCIIIYFLPLLLLLAIGCGEKKSGKDLEIVGSGAPEEILKKLADAYNRTNSGYRVIIPKSIGTVGALRTVGNNEYILGRVARSSSNPVKELAYLPFARDQIVFLVGDGVGGSVKSLTEQQILDIYSGKIDNWAQLSGGKGHIRLLFREDVDTSLAILRKDFSGFKDLKFNDQMKMVYLDYEMIDMFKKYPTAIGWLTSSSITKGLNPIALDGIAPTRDNLLSGKYKYAIEYAFVYKKGRLDKAANKFIAFIFSDQGRRIIEENGMIALSKR